MRKIAWLIVVALLCIAVSAPATAQNNQTVLQLAVPIFLEDILQPVLDQYNADHPDVLVVLSPYQGFGLPVETSDDPEVYLDNLESYFGSADVLLVDSGLTPTATRAGYLLDLSPLTGSDPAFNEADFESAILPSFEWDGRQWALPISTSFTVLTYLPDAFDAAGLTYPTASWSLSDLEYAARQLTQYNADGTTALPGVWILGGGTNGSNGMAALFLSLLGQGVYDDAYPSGPNLNQPDLVTDLEAWLQMETDGILTLPQGVNLADLQIPMTIGNPQTFGGGFGRGQNQNQNQPTTATALLPGGRSELNATGYAISSGTLYPDAAYDFLKYLIHNRNAVAASFGSLAAVKNLDESTSNQPGQGGPGGGGGFGGGFLGNALNIPENFQPLLDDALQYGMTVADMRFSNGIATAWNLMHDDSLDAETALDQAQAEIAAQLTAADTRASNRIVVQAPNLPPTLTPGEIALNFAVLGGGSGFVVEQQWRDTADQFAASDPEVGYVNIGTENENQFSDVVGSYDCLYSSSNLVPDADLSQLLSLDPLISADPSFDPDDFISGVFDQVRVNNQTWALPLQISPLVLRFNYDVMDMAGVTPPDGTWTVSQFEDAIRQIKPVLNADEYPVHLNASGPTALLTLMADYGGIPIDTRTDPPTINFTDPATVTAMQQVLDLVKEGYINYSSGGGGGGGIVIQIQGASNPTPIYSSVLNAFGFGGFGGGAGGGGGRGGGFFIQQGQAQQTPDGVVTFPLGTQFNAVPFNLGTAYISATTQHADACYRFITFLSDSPDLFQSMPARRSQINSPQTETARGAETVAFFNSLADLMEQPTTILVSTNINAGTFGMTNWLFDLFDRYINDEVVDFQTDLQQAQQITQDYLACVNALPPFDPAQEGFQSFFQQINQCQAQADPNAS